jgi:hypothetical protein
MPPFRYAIAHHVHPREWHRSAAGGGDPGGHPLTLRAPVPPRHDLARWLLDEELGGRREDGALLDAADRVARKLGGRLARLVTADGYRALLARALHLSAGAFPVLRGVRPGATDDVGFDGLREQSEGVDTAALRAAVTAALGAVLGLLAAFIGEDIAARLVRDVWPDAPADGIGADHSRATDHAGEGRP